MAVETRTRLGPYVHAKVREIWEDRRANIVVLPVRCRLCKSRIEAGALVLRLHERGYAGGCCLACHIRGAGACPLCDRLRMDGPKCRACGGTGYGSRRED